MCKSYFENSVDPGQLASNSDKYSRFPNSSDKVGSIFLLAQLKWAATRENLSSRDLHPRRLISAFVIRFLKSIICKLGTGEISIF